MGIRRYTFSKKLEIISTDYFGAAEWRQATTRRHHANKILTLTMRSSSLTFSLSSSSHHSFGSLSHEPSPNAILNHSISSPIPSPLHAHPNKRHRNNNVKGGTKNCRAEGANPTANISRRASAAGAQDTALSSSITSIASLFVNRERWQLGQGLWRVS